MKRFLSFITSAVYAAALVMVPLNTLASEFKELEMDFERNFGRVKYVNAGNTTSNTISRYQWNAETEKDDWEEFGTSLKIDIVEKKNSEAVFFMNDDNPLDKDIEVCYSIKRTGRDYAFCHTYRSNDNAYKLLTFKNGKIFLFDEEISSYLPDVWYDIKLSTYISSNQVVLSVKEHSEALWQTYSAMYPVTPTQRIALGYYDSNNEPSAVYIDDFSVTDAPMRRKAGNAPEEYFDFENDNFNFTKINHTENNTIARYFWNTKTQSKDFEAFGTSLEYKLIDPKNTEAFVLLQDESPVTEDISTSFNLKLTGGNNKFCYSLREHGKSIPVLNFYGGKILLLENQMGTYKSDVWLDVRIVTKFSEGKIWAAVKEHNSNTWHIAEEDILLSCTERISIGYNSSSALPAAAYIDNYFITGVNSVYKMDVSPSYENENLWADSLSIKNAGNTATSSVNLYSASEQKPVNIIVGYYDNDTNALEEVYLDKIYADNEYRKYSISHTIPELNNVYRRIFCWEDSSLKPVLVNEIEKKSEYELLKEKITVMYAYSPYVLEKGQHGYINVKDKTETPQIKNGDIYIPVSFFENAVAKKLNIEEEYESVTKLCEMSDTYLFSDDNGIIVFSDEDLNLSYENDKKLIDRLSIELLCNNVNGMDIFEQLCKRTHPYTVFNQETLSEIKEQILNNEEIYTQIYSYIKRQADTYLKKDVVEYSIPDGIRMIDCSEEVLERVLTLCIAYTIENNSVYAERAWDELYNISEVYNDWNPYHFLDTGIMCSAAAIGYDMLYNYLDNNQKQILRNAIIEKGLKPANEDFLDLTRQRSWDWLSENGNWRFVCCGGIGMAALAIANDTTGKERKLCSDMLENSLYYIKDTLAWFSPQGAYEEGIRYWDFGTQYLTMFILSLRNSTGSDFGYFDFPGMRKSPEFVNALNGSVSIFNYHDAGGGSNSVPPQIMFFADAFNNYGDAARRIEIIEQGGETVFDLLYYKPEMKQTVSETEKNIYFGNGIETAVMRTGFGKNDIYLGFHSDNTYTSGEHDHMDAGEFVLDMLGCNFFTELGSDNYNIANYYRDAYRFRAEGHNTIVINPDETPGQKYGAKVKIDRHSFGENSSFAISDMTDAYSDHASSVLRGVRLDDATVSVRDEVVMKKPSDFWWFAHTKADIKISDDEKSAELTIGDKTLIAKIQSGEGAFFSKMDAVPFESSPNPSGQEQNTGIQKLCINIKNCESIDLCVSFYEQGTNCNTSALASLSQW